MASQLSISVKVSALQNMTRLVKEQVLKDENEIVRRSTFRTRRDAQEMVHRRYTPKTKWSQSSVYAQVYDRIPSEPAVGRVAMSLRKWGKLKWAIDGGVRTADSIEGAEEFVLVRTDGRGRSGSTRLFNFASRVESANKVTRERFGGRSRGGLVAVPLKKNPSHLLVLKTTSRVRGRGDDRRAREYGERVGYLVPATRYKRRRSFDASLRILAVRNLQTTTRRVFGRKRIVVK